jgi:hypothetical protein
MADETREFLKKLKLWFNDNRSAIIAGHEGEQVLLIDNSVQGYFPDIDTALIAAQNKGFEFGTFLIQDCITKEEELKKHHFRGAVRFA